MNVTGTIEKIKETMLVSDKFQKREFVVRHGENLDYQELSSFEFTQDKCDVLDSYKEGQEVEVEFNLKGRKWTDAKGETKYFNTLQAWKINATGNTVSSAPKKNNVAENAYADSESLPF